MKGWHMLICVALIAAGIVLIAAGAGTVALIPVMGCVLMVGVMAWMMGKTGGE